MALTILLASLPPEGRPANKSPLSKTTLSAPGVMGGAWYFSLSFDDSGAGGGGAGCVASVGGGGEGRCWSVILLNVVVELLLVVEREVDEEDVDTGGKSSMLAERAIGSAVGAVGGMISCEPMG